MKKGMMIFTAMTMVSAALFAKPAKTTGYVEKTAKEIRKENKGMANPFGLVYDNPITENVEGKVNIHPVYYYIGENKIAANIYTPAGYKKNNGKKYAAITVAHPNGGVKEQVSGLFAQKLAEAGYITIAADAAFQGGSEGTPRYTDTPANRVEDIHRMIDIISVFPGVDTDRIGALGICGGGGYTIKAVQTDKRVKAVAAISLFNTGRVRLNGFQNSQVDSIHQRLLAASEARTQETRTGEVVISQSDPRSKDPAVMEALPDGLYKDGSYYYGIDYMHPRAGGTNPSKNLLDLSDFDAAHNAELITVPLLLIAGSEADTLYMTEDVFKAATGTKDKELYLVKGARHIPTYFVPEYVADETAKLTEFFGSNLQ